MINLHLNLDEKQPVQFSSSDALKKSVVANPHKYDGLCFLSEDWSVLELVYSEAYSNWEVAEDDGSESESFSDVGDAVSYFVEELKDLGVCY
jgi:hypothetical protein